MKTSLKVFLVLNIWIFLFFLAACNTEETEGATAKMASDSLQLENSSPKQNFDYASIDQQIATDEAEPEGSGESMIGLTPITIGIVIFILVLITVFVFIPTKPWLKAIAAGFWIWPHTLISMRLSGVDITKVIDNLIVGRNAGLTISVYELEALYLAHADLDKAVNGLVMAHNGHIEISLIEIKSHILSGGDVEKVVHAMVAAHSADTKAEGGPALHLDFHTAAAIDHSGIDILEAVESYIKPKVVETDEVIAVTKDGIEMTARVRLTIRANLKKLVSGADETTVIAKTNEAIVTIIGQASSHKQMLENPFEIGEKVMAQRVALFANTAYDVLSVDVSGVKILKDVNAELSQERSKAKLEEEKAREQEMKTRAAEARVHHIHAESEVQQAMAEAFRDGNISVQDYHKLMNTGADTEMRKAFTNPPTKDMKEIE